MIDEKRFDDEVPYIREHGFYFDGQYITPDSHPLCLIDDDEIHCLTCEFFVKSTCKLFNDPQAYDDVRTWLEILRDQRLRTEQEEVARRARRHDIVRAARRELIDHGLPLHYSKLGSIIRERYPNLEASDAEIYRAMYDRPSRFVRINTGIYMAKVSNDES